MGSEPMLSRKEYRIIAVSGNEGFATADGNGLAFLHSICPLKSCGV
jgi:hypothetical protein